MPRKSQGIYHQYGDHNMEHALEAVKSGQLSARKAATKFGVPRATLGDHLTGKILPGSRPGRKSALPPKVEDRIVSMSLDAADKGFGLTRQLVRKTAQVCDTLGVAPFKNAVPSQDWFRGLKSSHPELILRKPEKLSCNRS